MLMIKEDNPFYSQLKSIILYFISTIAVALVISMGLVTSTQISGYHLQNVYLSVDKNTCTCDCWDGFFRGIYGRGGYKLFYFNYEQAIIIILTIVLFYSELLRQIFINLILKKPRIFLCFIPSIYSNFYGIWSIINYINDQDYHRMLKSQIYFSLTELIVSYLFYQCLIIPHHHDIPPWVIYFLGTISSLHIFLAFGELNADRIGRNFILILSDIISLSWVIIMIIRYQRFQANMRTIYLWLLIAMIFWLFYYIFCTFTEEIT